MPTARLRVPAPQHGLPNGRASYVLGTLTTYQRPYIASVAARQAERREPMADSLHSQARGQPGAVTAVFSHREGDQKVFDHQSVDRPRFHAEIFFAV